MPVCCQILALRQWHVDLPVQHAPLLLLMLLLRKDSANIAAYVSAVFPHSMLVTQKPWWIFMAIVEGCGEMQNIPVGSF